ncbi:MAG: hypothetical protein IJZ87_09720 [Bacteroidales bacterium]|nr:hypothetical protein [Bacteroidales bacterium]
MSIIGKLFGNSQKSINADIRDPHTNRYFYEYKCIPYWAATYPEYFFSPDIVTNYDYLEMLLENDFETEWGKQYKVAMKSYGLENGQLSLLKFPEPQSSPELLYAAVVGKDEAWLNLKGDERPKFNVHILAKIADSWFVGEIKPTEIRNDEEYIVSYHKRVEEPNLAEFIEWVLQREGMSGSYEQLRKKQIADDPILSHLEK